jgi:hypothetical protein
VDDSDSAYTLKGSRWYVENPCKCAMSDTVTGYCSSVIGTNDYINALAAYSTVLGASYCHTLDRANWRA